MFDKSEVSRTSIVTSALSEDNRKIVVRYFVNRVTGIQQRGNRAVFCSMAVSSAGISSGGSRIFARGVRQLVLLECPKPLHALSPPTLKKISWELAAR